MDDAPAMHDADERVKQETLLAWLRASRAADNLGSRPH